MEEYKNKEIEFYNNLIDLCKEWIFSDENHSRLNLMGVLELKIFSISTQSLKGAPTGKSFIDFDESCSSVMHYIDQSQLDKLVKIAIIRQVIIRLDVTYLGE